jgi:DNA-binding SARP family transcriptional activator
VEFRILGPLEVLENGRQLALGSPRQRALLARLLLDADRVVSIDQLIDALWPEDPPVSARHALEVYVSRLRKQLHADGGARLETRAPGYALHLDGDHFDARQFERLIQEGRRLLDQGWHADAAERFRRAGELWRGEPLADLADEPFAHAAAGRLEELRLVAVEERIDADLALGRHVELVPELRSLVVDHPLRERLPGQLMLALYRSGRQAEALEEYRSARSRFRDELGLDPSTTLQELERAILKHDPELELAGRVSAWLPAPLA